MQAQLLTTIEIAPGVRETAVRFPVAGCRLAGNLIVPNATPDAAVLFVHGFSGTRCGPHDLLTQLARELGRAHLASLRFDLSGRGESEGDGRITDLASMAEDVLGAARFLRRQQRADKIILAGICSGGNVAIGALPRLPGVAGLVLLSVYPFSDGDTFARDVHRTWHYLRVYARKACRAETWRRLGRGQVHVGAVVRVLCGHFRKPRTDPAAPAASATAAAAAKPPTRHLSNLRPDVAVMMIYGTADPDTKAARRYFERHSQAHELAVRFEEIQDANHNFSSTEWTAAVCRLVRDFCCRHANGPLPRDSVLPDSE